MCSARTTPCRSSKWARRSRGTPARWGTRSWRTCAAAQRRALAGDLVPLTGQTKTSRAALSRALTQVRRRGYAVEDQEATVGDAGIAAPIFARDGVVAGSIGVVGAADRLLAPPAREELTRPVKEAARAISRDLGAGRGGVRPVRVELTSAGSPGRLRTAAACSARRCPAIQAATCGTRAAPTLNVP